MFAAVIDAICEGLYVRVRAQVRCVCVVRRQDSIWCKGVRSREDVRLLLLKVVSVL